MTRRFDTIGLALLLVAVLLAVWLGLGAPDVSPIFTEAPGFVGEGARFGDGPGGGRG